MPPADTPDPPWTFRDTVRPDDRLAVRHVVASTGFFYPFEIDVAVELVEECLARGPASGYHFLFADEGSATVGFACYGPIACTQGSFDLYWIAVDAAHQGQGIGRALMHRVEDRIARAGGRRIYIETSGRDQYQPTRQFYEQCGYHVEGVLKDFYAPGDDKLIYMKKLADRSKVVRRPAGALIQTRPRGAAPTVRPAPAAWWVGSSCRGRLHPGNFSNSAQNSSSHPLTSRRLLDSIPRG